MSTKRRVTFEERHLQILEAAIPLFSEQGFAGVTTKAIAQEAGVSEALIYQHFPSKETLYEEVQRYCCQPLEGFDDRLLKLAPATESLVFLFYVFARITIDNNSFFTNRVVMSRLMIRSLVEDGGFARLVVKRRIAQMIPLVESCLEAGKRQGEVVDTGIGFPLSFWFSQHVISQIHVFLLSEVPIVDYGVTKQELIVAVTRYILRGLGLTDEALSRYIEPDAHEKRLAELINGRV